MILAINTRMMNSLDIYLTTLATDAPRTFLIPISLVRCSAVNEDSPNIPRQEIKRARIVKTAMIFPGACSER